MQETFQQTFAPIYGEAFALLVERQRKYGPDNIRSAGLFGVFSRMSNDKIERIRRGMNGRVEHGQVIIEDFSDFGDESFEDALLDIANYALIMLALKRGRWGRPLGDNGRLILDTDDGSDFGPRDLDYIPVQDALGEHYATLEPQAWVQELHSNFSIATPEEMAMVMGTD